MANKKLPDQARLRQLLDYDPETGRLTWKAREAASFESFGKSGRTIEVRAKLWKTIREGRPAMEIVSHNDGYFRGGFDGECYAAHRIIWKWWHGDEPQIIDHANGRRRDNRITNLRAATHSLNARNVGINPRNTSGRTGVKPSSSGKKWQATICVDGRRLHLGTFERFEDACRARSMADVKYGFGENHGLKSPYIERIN